MGIKWFSPSDFPDVLSDADNGFSIDVFIYIPSSDERTVGWFDYTKTTWNFLCREAIGSDWKWRYFDDKIDKF